MNAVAKKVNRGWLLRRALEGKLWLKCNFSLTDDYAFDNAYNFGEMDHYKQVAVMPEYVKPDGYDQMSYDDQRRLYGQFRDDFLTANQGKIIRYKGDFKGSGYVFGDKQKGSFSVHSNLSYEYEVR